jgi:uncharacterized protein (TIGR00369 family)
MAHAWTTGVGGAGLAGEESTVTPKEAIAQFMRGEYQQGGIAKTFGWYAVEWREGVFEIHWRATEAFTTGQMSVIHGGAITTLLDTAMGWAAYTMLQDDENFATADLQVQFVRGAKVGLLHFAKGRCVMKAISWSLGPLRRARWSSASDCGSSDAGHLT